MIEINHASAAETYYNRFVVDKLLSVVHRISNCYMLKLIKEEKTKQNKMRTEQK